MTSLTLESLGLGPADAQRMHLTLLEQMIDGVYLVDTDRRILFWNESAERLTGYSAAEVVGSRCADGILEHVTDCGECLCQTGCPLAATMDDGGKREGHVFLHHKRGHRVPVHVKTSAIHDQHGRVIGGLEVFNDDTPRVGYLDRLAQLEQIAYIDELTGLANRRYLFDAMDAKYAEAARHDQPFGVILMDVDHFKKFNDTHGHHVGDEVLKLVARTLAQNSRPYDTVCRWGGEEFLVLVCHATLDEVGRLAERARSLVSASALEVDSEKLSVTISGGATFVRPGESRDDLIRRADELLYESKRQGRNRVTVAA